MRVPEGFSAANAQLVIRMTNEILGTVEVSASLKSLPRQVRNALR